MTIECTGQLHLQDGSELMCNRCFRGATELWVMVEDGNTDDEQYICVDCAADVVVSGFPLGRLVISAPPGQETPPSDDDDITRKDLPEDSAE